MTAAAVPRSRWLFGPASDLLLGAGLAYAGVFLLLAFFGPEMRRLAPEGLLPLLSVVTGTPHYGATLLRVYERRQDRTAYALFAVHATIAVWIAFAIGVYDIRVGSWFLTLYLTWSPWHYSGQNYGIALMFLGRNGVRVPPAAKRCLYASFLLSFGLTFLAIHGADPTVSYAPVPFGGVAYRFYSLGIPFVWLEVLFPLFFLGWVASLLFAMLLLRSGASWRALAPAAVMVGTQALWFVIPVMARAAQVLQNVEPLSTQYATYAFLWIAFAHSVQYLWVTTYYARSSPGYPGGARYYAKCLLAGSAIWGVPALLFAPSVLGTHPFDAGLAVLVASAVNVHHFILDGAIWKLRDGRIARILLRSGAAEGAATEAAAERPRRSLLRPAVYVLGGAYVIVTLIGTLELEVAARRAYERLDLDRLRAAAERLHWVGRDHAGVELFLGDLAAREGRTEEALDAFRRSLELNPTPAAWIAVGTVEQRGGDLPAAAAAFDAAVALEPANPDALHRLGLVRLARGELEEARELLSRAVTHAPERQDLRKSLRQAMRAR